MTTTFLYPNVWTLSNTTKAQIYWSMGHWSKTWIGTGCRHE